MYRVFELLVNIFQSFAVTDFLIKCLGVKNNYGKPILEYATGVAVTLIYLEILNRITAFESAGVFVYLFISMFFSIETSYDLTTSKSLYLRGFCSG